MWLLALVVTGSGAGAQVNVVTAHNDIGRTGQNLNETILTRANVNPAQFGKLFSQPVTGSIHGQPLYMPRVTIPGNGVHNVVYVATDTDSVYAFDADSNGGAGAKPLWHISLLTNTSPSGTYATRYGIFGTPVIDPTSNTMYLASSENKGSTAIYRLHALDIASGAEKFGAPVQIQASIAGTGSGSSSGVLAFNPAYQYQRPGLLLLNGVVYITFGAVDDQASWHGWIFSYNAATLAQIDVYCATPDGSGAGFWMGGAGPAAEVNDLAKPYGRMFIASGNGSYAASTPYTNTMSYGMSVVDLDLSGGVMTVEDEFTPYNEAALDAGDGDLGSGGPLLLPSQTTASGATLNPLVEAGKSGTIYILDRNNLGGFNATGNRVVQEVQTPVANSQGWGAGIWGSEAYWNGNVYYGGIYPTRTNNLNAYSFINGSLSTAPTSATVEEFGYPGPTPSISANGTTNGIVWVLNYGTGALPTSTLMAYDATSLANLLYSSNTNLSRDNPGVSVGFAVPTVINGKVYVGTQGQLSVFGLLGSTPTVASPVISPPGATFTGSQTVTISDATPGAQIYYTTNGSTPTVNSTLYSRPFAITSNATITAIASSNGYLQNAPVAAVFSSTANAANPVLSLASGTYTGTQRLTITDASANASIYYTVNGTTPTTASNLYSGPIAVAVGETVQAIATAPGLLGSSVVSATYIINPAYTIDFSQGFAGSQQLGQLQFNGSTDLDDVRLQLTNGEKNEAGSAFYTQKVNVQSFTTDFTFQLSNPAGDGITFAIQGDGTTALGASSQGLGYAGMPKSVAIYFNTNNRIGLGNDATGVYTTGSTVHPAIPPLDLNNTGINLRSGDFMNVHITYDGKILNLTITDAVTLATWSHAFTLAIPYHVGSSIGYVGFTGGTGGAVSSQKLTYWTYLAGTPPVPNYVAVMEAAGLSLNGGAAIAGTALELTNGGQNETSSAYYTTPVDIDSFTTNFNLTIAPGSTSTLADGLTFVIQNAGTTALGTGSGGLGFAIIPKSVAIKFDVFNNAGEGTDSTGLYLNGAMPTVPSTNLTGTGVELGGGRVAQVQVIYNGATLRLTIHTVGGGSFSDQWTINIPQTIGSNTAYIGFTAASGDGTAIQQVLNWTFSNP